MLSESPPPPLGLLSLSTDASLLVLHNMIIIFFIFNFLNLLTHIYNAFTFSSHQCWMASNTPPRMSGWSTKAQSPPSVSPIMLRWVHPLDYSSISHKLKIDSSSSSSSWVYVGPFGRCSVRGSAGSRRVGVSGVEFRSGGKCQGDEWRQFSHLRRGCWG